MELYDIVNVTRIIYNLEPVETVDKNEKKIHLRKATLQDKTNDGISSKCLAIWLIKLIKKVWQ